MKTISAQTEIPMCCETIPLIRKLFRKPPLDLETLLSFLVEEKYPNINFFIDEIPTVGKSSNLFKGLKIKGIYLCKLQKVLIWTSFFSNSYLLFTVLTFLEINVKKVHLPHPPSSTSITAPYIPPS